MKKKPAKLTAIIRADYETILIDVVRLLEEARRTSARAVNTVMTATYWRIGRRIVESEMRGRHRADYGEQLIDRLSADLTARFGRGFSRRAVYQMRSFYEAYPEIVQSPIAQSSPGRAPQFPLPWTHYVHLLSIENVNARKFYETEALRGGWTVKQLDRQIGSAFYERTALSRNKVAMLTKHNRGKSSDQITPEEELKDPFVLEFLGLKDEYSETEIEEALSEGFVSPPFDRLREKREKLDPFAAQVSVGDCDAYTRLGELSAAKLDALIDVLTVECITAHLQRPTDLVTRLAVELKVNIRDHWRPDAAWLSGFQKIQLSQLISEILGPAHAPSPDKKKSELVEALANRFSAAAEGTVEDKKLAERLNQWLPANLRVSGDTEDPIS